jgi:hypothetical protein
MDRRRSARALVVALVIFSLESCSDNTRFSDGDAEGDAIWEVDADEGADAEEAACPDDMVSVSALRICIDRYEATTGPAGVLLAVADAQPWTNVTWAEAEAACDAVAKRLCTPDEWIRACSGPTGHVYPYGDSYRPHACNGFDHGAGIAVATGTMDECEGGYPGLFDMSGNVWEWVSSCEFGLCRVRGGSFNRQEVGTRCSADLGFDPEERYGAIGFRCCRDL